MNFLNSLFIIHVLLYEIINATHFTENATPNAYPFMAFIFRNGKKDRCAGVLMSDQYVLTAGYCVRSNYDDSYPITVILGAHNVNQLEKTQRRFVIVEKKDIIYHPKYAGQELALIKLPEKIELNNDINKINFLEEDVPLVNEKAVFLGWGRNFWFYPSQLQVTKTKIWENDKCRRLMRTISDDELCVSGPRLSLSPVYAKGDSGGPLIINCNNTIVLVGVAVTRNGIFGLGPSIFAKISSFSKWIGSEIDESSTQ